MGRLKIGGGRWIKKVGSIVKEQLVDRIDGDNNGDPPKDGEEGTGSGTSIVDNWMERIVGDGDENDKDVNWKEKFHAFIEMTKRCRIISNETIQLCEQTEDQHDRMIKYTNEIKSTFITSGLVVDDNNNKNEPSTNARETTTAPEGSDDTTTKTSDNDNVLDIIKDLTDGDKVKEAMEIANGIRDIAQKCIIQSTELSTLMGQGIDDIVPDWIQKMIPVDDDDDDDADDDDDDDINMNEVNDNIKGIDQDMNDIKSCIDNIQNNMNIHNAIEIGCNTFIQLNNKCKRSNQMFNTLKEYSKDIYNITHSNINKETLLSGQVKVKTLIDIVKSTSRIIKYSDIMKSLSDYMTKLLNILIELFDVASNNISKLWSALSYAKDCMKQCLTCMNDTKELCNTAQSTSTDFITHSVSLSKEFQQFKGIKNTKDLLESPDIIKTVQSFASKDGDLQETIRISKSIDDIILKCTNQVMTMIDTVQDSFKKFPSMLQPSSSSTPTPAPPTTTEDQATTPPPPPEEVTTTPETTTKERGDVNVEESSTAAISNSTTNDNDDEDVVMLIKQLDETKIELEKSDFLSAIQKGETYFILITDIMKTKCMNMILSLLEYNTKSINTIQSFIQIWDVKTISNKLIEMTSMIEYGETIRYIAKSLQNILKSIIEYLKSALTKYSNPKNLIPSKEDTVHAVTETLLNNDMVHDVVDNVVDNVVDSMKDKFKIFRK